MSDKPEVIERAVTTTGGELVALPIMDRLLMAAQGGMDIALIERFMALAERQETREAEKAFHVAFAAFKADPPQIVKDKQVGFGNTKYKHATIGNVVTEIISGMSKHGLSHRWNTVQDGATITVVCRISHILGHTEETSLSAGSDNSGGKNAIQAIGSTVTYLERYTLQAATGIAVLEPDDDGRGADGITQPPANKKGKKDDKPPPQTERKPGDGGETPPERKAVEAWLKLIDDHVKMTGDNVSTVFESWWASALLPHLKSFPVDQRNELEIAYKDTLRIIQERKGGAK